MHDNTNHPFSAAIFIVIRRVARIGIIVMLSVLSTQCGVPSASTAEPTPSPPTAILVSSPTPLAATLDMANPTSLPKHPPPSRPRPSPVARFAQLLPDHHGWLLADQELWWTDDGGDHWRAITPALPPATTIAQAAFVDAVHGWLLLVGATESIPGHIYVSAMRTTDSGQTWQISSVTTYTNCFSCMYAASNSAQSDHVHALSFLDAHQGWILVNRTESMNSRSADLFHTGDGGQTWQQIPDPPRFGQLSFVSDRTGWLVGACCTGAPVQLWQTNTGGASWAGVSLPDAPSYRAIVPPTFYAPARGVLAVQLTDDQGSGTGQLEFYRTDDAGASWSLTALLPDPALRGQQADEGLTTVRIIDTMMWAVAVNQQLYLTADGGQTWKIQTRMQDTGGFLTLELFPDHSGWGLILKDNCGDACIQLVRTKDDGQQWQTVALPVTDKR